MITNGFTYIAFLILLAGGLLALQKYTNWKIFKYVPALVLIYLLNMVFCTIGLYDMSSGSAVKAAYSGIKNNILYAMIFVLLLRCDFRKLAKLGPRMITIFLGCTVTIALGFIAGYPIFVNLIGGVDKTYGAVSALFASWVAGSGAMAAVGASLGADEGAYACALALDTVLYSLWWALMLFMVKYTEKWNRLVKADTSKLDAIAEISNAEVAKEKTNAATGTDWLFLLGISLAVSALGQWVGVELNGMLKAIGIAAFDSGTLTCVFITVLGLICAMTPMGKLPAADELSTVYMYAVVSLLASTASLIDLISAPMWIVYGVFVLAIHAGGMFLLCKLFHWDLAMSVTGSVANIGGTVSAPIVAAAFSPSYAGIGVLMGVLGAALGNICGIGMSFILQLFG